MSRTKLIDATALPLTHAEIRAQFDDKPLRAAVWSAARRGDVTGVARRIALSAGGKASLDAVQAVLAAEWTATGLDKVYVGEADPSVYGEGQVAAYLDQPL